MLRFDDPVAIRELTTLTSTRFQIGHDKCLARFDGDRFLGGVLYTDYNHASVQMHVGAVDPRWVDRSILWVAFDWPFRKLNVLKVFGLVRSSNLKALDFDLNVGFKVEAVLKDVFAPGEDTFVLALYREDCRFLRMRRPPLTFEGIDGQVVRTT